MDAWVRQQVAPYLERQQRPVVESIGSIEETMLANAAYIPITYAADEFSLAAVRFVGALAKAQYITNPVVKRSVDVRAYYTFGQGMSVSSPVPAVQEVIDAFMLDRQNRRVLTGHTARVRREVDAIVTGNLYFLLATDRQSGKVRVRLARSGEIDDIIYGQDGSPLYYHRVWTRDKPDLNTGVALVETVEMYYPDWRHDPPAQERPATINGRPITWDERVYHVKRNTVEESRYGISELVSVREAAEKYIRHLDNISAINETLAIFAMMATSSTKAGAEAVATTLQARADAVRLGTEQPGGIIAATGDVALQPVRSGGVATSADEGRRQLLLVCSGTGFPEHYVAGDPSTGNLATATSMERPVELLIANAQEGWREVFADLLDYAVRAAATAPGGPFMLGSEGDEPTMVTVAGEVLDSAIEVTFPPILEHDRLALVQAVAAAASAVPGELFPREFVQREFLKALGVPDPEAVLADLDEAATAADLDEAARLLARAKQAIGRVVGVNGRAVGEADAGGVPAR